MALWATVCLAAAPLAPYTASLSADGGLCVRVDGAKDPTVAVLRKGRAVWRGVPKRWHPWKIAVADVDRDGRPELLVGVHKPTAHKPFPHHCLFVYNINRKSVTKKWLGSSLGLDFDDFLIETACTTEKPRLVLNEIQLDGKRTVGKYEWMGFGFWKMAESPKFDKVKLLGVRDGIARFVADGQMKTF